MTYANYFNTEMLYLLMLITYISCKQTSASTLNHNILANTVHPQVTDIPDTAFHTDGNYKTYHKFHIMRHTSKLSLKFNQASWLK